MAAERKISVGRTGWCDRTDGQPPWAQTTPGGLKNRHRSSHGAACATADLTAQDDAIIRQLPQVRSFRISSDGILELVGATNQTLITYTST